MLAQIIKPCSSEKASSCSPAQSFWRPPQQEASVVEFSRTEEATRWKRMKSCSRSVVRPTPRRWAWKTQALKPRTVASSPTRRCGRVRHTSTRRAIVTGPHEIVHIAIQQAEIAAHNIANLRRPRTADYRLLTSVVFTEPQVATVGLTEKEANARGIPSIAASHPFNDHGKSLIISVERFCETALIRKTGEILGGCCVGPVGGELIHEINVAMAKRMTVHEFAATPHYHPTLAEIWTYLAEELAEQIR